MKQDQSNGNVHPGGLIKSWYSISLNTSQHLQKIIKLEYLELSNTTWELY